MSELEYVATDFKNFIDILSDSESILIVLVMVVILIFVRIFKKIVM